MIEIDKLTEQDVGRRVIWRVAPGVENPAQIAAWTDDRLILAMPQTGSRFLRMVEDVDPREVAWADVKKSHDSAA